MVALVGTAGETNRLDEEVLRTEGRLIARTTDLLRQSGARTERNLGDRLTSSLEASTSHNLGWDAAGAVVALLCAFFVAHRTVRPLRYITQAMRRLADGALMTEVPYLNDRTEIGAMARATDVFKRAMIEVDEAHREAQRALEQQRRAEEEYRKLFEDSVEGIYYSTPDGRLLRANPALARLLGFASLDDMRSAPGGTRPLPLSASKPAGSTAT